MKPVQKPVQKPVDQVSTKCIYIGRGVHLQAKIRATEQGKSLRDYTEDALQKLLQEERSAA